MVLVFRRYLWIVIGFFIRFFSKLFCLVVKYVDFGVKFVGFWFSFVIVFGILG